MNNSVLLQKTIRDNNEDLTNFMRSLKHWESDMKRKDAQLSTPTVSEEFLPPVRSKPRKEKPSKKKLETKNEKPKRISSFDYSKWEKFDVEKACEDIDKGVDVKDIEVESDNDDDEEQEIERLRQQAMYEKELGNKYVKKEKWKEAIEQYTKAIKCFDKDAVFYANRALCYLKINKLNASEEDCNKSLQLDSSYVKAYQRRAAARTALKKYKEAEADFNSILRLEPNNTQAKRDLEKLKVHLKPHNIKEQNKSLTEKSDSKKQSSSVESLKKPNDKSEALNELSRKESKKKLPWEPVDPARIIKPVYKPPHIRSKKPLRRIEIIDVDDSTMKDVNVKALCLKKDVSEKKETTCIINKTVKREDTLNSTNNLTPKKEVLESTNMEKPSKLVKNQFSTCNELESDKYIEIPPPPKTSVQFYNEWKKLKHNPDLLYKYFQKIDGRCLPTIFQDSLESDVFSSMINIFSTEFVKYNMPVLNYIEGLLNIRRFEMLVLFMNKKDKEGINILLDYCLKNNDITNEDRLVLRERFKLSD